MKKVLFTQIILLFGLVAGFGQRVITGNITDENSDPLIGATVLIKGTQAGTVTDENGNFSLNAPDGAVLIIRYTGFVTREIEASHFLTNSAFTLSEDQTLLDELVVTGLGISRSQKSLGYAVSQVEQENLVENAEPDLLKNLQGKVPGVDIRTSQGAPGSATRIQIRGNSSFGLETQPLIIVDGVPYSNEQVTTSSQTSGGTAYGSGIAGLDPNDIESFNVLKGAAAAAIYGSRASRGVIIVTTKSGSRKAKEGFSVNFRTSYGIENIANLPEYQNTYGAGTNFNYANANGSWGPAFDRANSGVPVNQNASYFFSDSGVDSIAAWPEYVNAYPELFSSTRRTPYRAYPDNVNELFRTGSVIENSIGVDGGNGKTRFGVTASYLDHKGYIENSSYKRTNIGVGGSTTVWDRLTVGGNLSYMKGKQIGGYFGENQVEGAASQFARSLFLARNWDLSLPYQDASGRPLIPNGGAQFDNPHWAAINNVATTDDERITVGGNLNLRVTDNINVTYNLGTNLYNLDRNEITAEFSRAANGLGRIRDDKYKTQETESTLNVSYNSKIGQDFDVMVNVGHNVNQREGSRLFNTGLDFIVPGIYSLKNTTSQVFDLDTRNKRRLIGVYGDVGFGFKNFLYLNLAGRNDWSSTLPKENRSYFYPAASASFVFSELINSDVLSFGKIRAGWAKVGNDAPVYRTQDVFVVGNNFKGLSQVFRSTNTNDPNLSPEFTTELELGTDLNFFGNRFGVDFTWYDKVTTDLIYDISVANTTGYETFTTNVGEISNTGIEIGANVVPVSSKNFNWRVGAAFTKNKNIVESLAPGLDRVSLNAVLTDLSPYLEPGLPFGYLRGSKSLKMEDGTLLINPATGGMIADPEQGMIGDPNPDYKLGLSTDLNYKNFFLSGLFDFTKGGDIYSVTLSSLLGRGVTMDTEDREWAAVIPGVYADPSNLSSGEPLLVDGQTVPNTTAITINDLYFSPNPTSGQTFAINTANEWNVYDATVLRLREVSLGYNIPNSLFNGKVFQKGTISVSGRNLWHLAPNVPEFTNFDPEVNSFGASTTQGIELSAAPTTRRYSINLNLTF